MHPRGMFKVGLAVALEGLAYEPQTPLSRAECTASWSLVCEETVVLAHA